ncbi:MAG: IS21 family transposase [Phycisphaerales bacterium]|nr:MAG: IS21 family transposase [Phycisphaerales bacterium]
MANQLGMAEQQFIITLAKRGWSFRRIARELGIHRETASRYVRRSRGDPGAPAVEAPSKPAISITGSEGDEASTDQAKPAISIAGSAGRRSKCEPFREVILGKLEQGLTAQRIWQDLADEHDFTGSYLSVQRFVRRLQAASPLPFRRMECAPGEEAQVDFGTGAPVVQPDGRRKRPHLFRIVLSHSRKAYSEVVYRQTAESFIRCLENAFCHFGGVPKTLVVDNLKAAVIKADWFDPDLNPKIQAFCDHYDTVILPTRPRTPRHKGKIERQVGYAQSNALKGKTFSSLAEQNAHLLDWETRVADTRIHGTTRKQVGQVFKDVERPALLPLPAARFPSFQEAQRIVSRDAHVEVDKAFYSVPPEYLGRRVWVRWDGRLVRIFDRRMQQIALHVRGEPGRFRTQPEHIAPAKISGVERGTTYLLRKARLIGPHTQQWAESMLKHRGIQGVRVLVGLLGLAGRHHEDAIEQACEIAQTHGAYRLRVIRELIKRRGSRQEQFEFIETHPIIRSLGDYAKLVRTAFQEVGV